MQGIKMKHLRVSVGALLVIALSACTPANHGDAIVAAERAKPIHRTDQFGAVAATRNRLVAGTLGGVLLTSQDAGKTWKRAELPQPASIIGISSCPDGVLVALDFHRKVWVDAGGRWESRPIDTKMDPVAMTCDGAGRLWVVGSRTGIVSSTDQGKTWTSAALDKDAILSGVHFFDPQHGIAVGEFGSVAATSDAGAHWVLSAPLPEEFYPYAMYFRDRDHGWVSGVAGALFGTADGGQTWVAVDNPAKAPIYALNGAGDEAYGVGADGRVIRWLAGAWTVVDTGDAGAGSGELTALTLLPTGGAFVAGGDNLHRLSPNHLAD
jgi:photosystem II stability/assembly factor-like uncharacterized protein